MSEKALKDVKVVDFGWVLVSPLIVKSLADYGATAVSVESIKSPSLSRLGTPFKDDKPGVDRAGHFAYCAPNKYSISLDMRNQGGMEIARKLVSWADIVSENRRAGIMKKMGLDYDELRKINPGVIMVSSSNQGQTGPYASHPGLGIHLIGLGGFNNFIGWPKQDPITLTVAYTDYLTPPLAVATVVAALDHRRKTGEGQFIDISQLEAGLHYLATPILDYTVNGREPEKIGNASQYAAPHTIFRCKGDDRWCAIAVTNDEEWSNFCKAINKPGWISEEKFSTPVKRKENEEELNQRIEEFTVQYTAGHIMDLMQKEGIPAGVVQNAKDIYEDPQLRHRNFFWVMNHQEMGEFTHLGEPAILSETPAQPAMPAPCLGEHTEYICKEFLGMGNEEFVEYMIAGAFGY
ncbi:MAG: CoA transferase [Deltaproteobacteria bacterium]|nr:CoA transferase [Deltaproteobacteria bacterium]